MVKDLKFNLAGKIVIAVCTLIAAAFCVFACLNSLVPFRFKLIICIGLGVLYALFMLTQFARPKALRIVIMILAIILSLVLAVGTYYLIRVQNTLNSVTSDVVYKTDNMIVVAPSDSEMENIDDAKEVVFGIQTAADIENTSKMIAHLENYYGTALKIKEYENINELIDALLKGEIDVIIYNDAFSNIIADSFADYLSKVKVLHQYGIKIEVQLPQEEPPAEGNDKVPSGEFDITRDPFCVYISGIDVEGTISKTSRSDVNIIMAVNPTTKKILLVTTPRDYYVPIPGVSGNMRDKLTHAGIYGVNASMNTLSQLYDINIKYYLRVNFTSLKTVVDALGGVDVYSEYAFMANKSHFITKGMNHLNGEQALSFCRERKSFSDGDNQRGKNQQAVLTAIIKKAMTPAILTRANELLNAVSGCMETNMTPDEIGRLVDMQLSDMASWEITSEAATGISDMNTCYSLGSYEVYVMWPNETSVEAIMKKLHSVLAK